MMQVIAHCDCRNMVCTILSNLEMLLDGYCGMIRHTDPYSMVTLAGISVLHHGGR
jgi:hypothetical protein